MAIIIVGFFLNALIEPLGNYRGVGVEEAEYGTMVVEEMPDWVLSRQGVNILVKRASKEVIGDVLKQLSGLQDWLGSLYAVLKKEASVKKFPGRELNLKGGLNRGGNEPIVSGIAAKIQEAVLMDMGAGRPEFSISVVPERMMRGGFYGVKRCELHQLDCSMNDSPGRNTLGGRINGNTGGGVGPSTGARGQESGIVEFDISVTSVTSSELLYNALMAASATQSKVSLWPSVHFTAIIFTSSNSLSIGNNGIVVKNSECGGECGQSMANEVGTSGDGKLFSFFSYVFSFVYSFTVIKLSHPLNESGLLHKFSVNAMVPASIASIIELEANGFFCFISGQLYFIGAVSDGADKPSGFIIVDKEGL
ncbi:hypothetical protein BDN71DRAFT_1430408 [Pleurotus eryngii]|uniref:Uncharacterized protein n=1 Tax=Pleurotus eryngii TaxID=5323 RepID=A0A9P6A0M5_PLEER|nr:hypothetical protein BDN71DRAFT_1430408 [Pleurotus eryngii]